MPGDPGVPSVTTLVCFVLFCTRGCGCIGHPAFPTPSFGRTILAQLGRIAPRDGGLMVGAKSAPASDQIMPKQICYSGAAPTAGPPGARRRQVHVPNAPA